MNNESDDNEVGTAVVGEAEVGQGPIVASEDGKGIASEDGKPIAGEPPVKPADAGHETGNS